MELNLKGKTAVVMASSKGLGKAVAEELAHEGATVVISSRTRGHAEQAGEEIRKTSGNPNVHAYECNMADADDIRKLFKEVGSRFGGVDILINNTGGPKAGGFHATADGDWQMAFETNLLSYIRTSREALFFMEKQQYGRIVNITSSSVKEVIDNLILSNTFRAGLVGFTKTLAREAASHGVLVNAVGPGKIATDRVAELDGKAAERENLSVSEITSRSQRAIPIGRYGQPAEFAKVVVFLASGANNYLTGQSLVVDGGMLKAL
ncbi:SDR family oxidoreductase [Indiicoccus explosivorum]|uniref:SDR family oxidoreductase n=1 Tax=Indiicoccus explosivorum TaxID=1917864 RepID=UPI000B4403D9|nr:SDR family oxidoreductase [Indiicoccus explosivorum]